jgi:peptide/nickel transport system permease protein
MIPFLIRRFAIMIPMMALMSVVAFGIIQAPPGDYLQTYIAQLSATGDYVDAAEEETLRKQYGLDKPIYIQYLKWVGNLLRGDLGFSLEYQLPVNQLIGERLGLTVLLALFTVLFTWTLAIPIGIISAVKQYSIIDYVFTFLSYIGVGTPNFLLALVIMWFVWAWFGLKITSLFSPEYHDAEWSIAKGIDLLKHIWVPMIILGTDGTARFTRIIRANLLDELSKPYVETARAKGLPEWQVILKYPTRIAINPFVSTMGWQLPQLFSGSLIVATVLSLPTIGPLLLAALIAQDMFMAGSIILILTVLTIVGTLISDIVLALVDPRIRVEG